MLKRQFTTEQLIKQLEITSMGLKAHIDSLKKDVEALDEFLIEYKKQAQSPTRIQWPAVR